MKTFYKILSFLLLPVGVFFGFIALFGLLMAFANLSILLSVFLLACTSIYIFTSFSFLNRSLLGGAKSPAKLFDWIRVNAFATGLFSSLLIAQGLAFFMNQELQDMLLKQMKQIPMATLSDAAIVKTLKLALGLFVALGACLFVHVVLTLRLLKHNRHLFA